MKVHLFYLRRDKVTDRELLESFFDFKEGCGNGAFEYIDGVQCILYAYTADKKVAENFKTLRNMNRFFYVTKRVPDDEVSDSRVFLENAYLLNESTMYCDTSIVIAITGYEYGVIESTIEGFSEYLDDLEESAYTISALYDECLKKKWRKDFRNSGMMAVLEALDYDVTYSFDVNVLNILFRYFRFTMV